MTNIVLLNTHGHAGLHRSDLFRSDLYTRQLDRTLVA